MSNPTTGTLWVVRYFTDADGDEGDIEIELTVSGSHQPSDPDCGVFSDFYEDLEASVGGKPFELDADEEEDAQSSLRTASHEDYWDAMEHRAECERDMDRIWGED